MGIIQIIPFDMGCSNHPLIEVDKQDSKNIVELLNVDVELSNWKYKKPSFNHCIASYYFDENLSCYLMEFGIGVFVLNMREPINISIEKYNKKNSNFSFDLYYAKKNTQRLILEEAYSEEGKIIIDRMHHFMGRVWNIIKQKTRQFSSTFCYKYKGFSYVLSIYHITVKECLKDLLKKDSAFYKNLYLLMEPSIMTNILDVENHEKIKGEIKNIEPKEFEYSNLSETSIVAYSWSGVAVVEQEDSNNDSLRKILEAEIRIQATWFLYDCIIDNINNANYSIVELQKMKSAIDYINMDMDNIISANMSTRDKDVITSIIESSGLCLIKDKVYTIINNKIAIESAYAQERSKRYSLFTEIVLLLLTIISAYDPIKSVVSLDFKTSDLIVGAILIIIFIVLVIFMVRKE